MKAPEKVVVKPVVPLDYTYNYRVGQYLEKYIQGLGEGKILAVRCKSCDKVIVPPRRVCGTEVLDEWVEVGPEGEVVNYTVGHVTLNKGLIEKADPPQLLAMVMLDGATVPLLAEVKGVDASGLGNGLRVKAVFKDPAEGTSKDLDYFEPV